MRFVHAATRTRDIDAAIRFYELLGMKIAQRKEMEKNAATLVYMEPPEGNFQIELVYNWGRDDAYEGGDRFGHFAFEVQGIDEQYARLLAGGAGDIGRPPSLLQGIGPTKIAFVADPDGNWIELIER
jgi:lactoylglutathione lyase